MSLDKGLVSAQLRFRTATVSLRARDKARIGIAASNGLMLVTGALVATVYTLPSSERLPGAPIIVTA
jgi:hypothetical protein